jgi:cytochrome c-type biogenesis protein CcmF
VEHLTDLGWPQAARWSIVTGDAGRAFIIAGLVAFLVAALSWIFAERRLRLQKIGTAAFVAGALCLFGALVSIGLLFVFDQFQYDYVRARAEVGTDLKYKISGIWSGQQGSFLLWGCASALFGLLSLRSLGPFRRWYIALYAGFLASICAILAYETPFDLTKIHGQILVPPNGAGLTPSLQNYWVAIHPPTIFLGFGSLTVLFCFAASAMLARDRGTWQDRVRPWALWSVALVGLGLCMGGFWAYETLGWGGFWAWDPVENVSLVPWVLTVALVHGIFVQKAGRGMARSNFLLAGLPFLAFVYGTFLTRSGFLTETSVHSFAEMDRNALWVLLGFLGLASVGFLALWAVRGKETDAEPVTDEPGIHRAGFYRTGVMLLSMFAVAIAIGMSIPFFMALFEQSAKVVEERLYHQVVVWFFVPIMLLMAVGPFVSWRAMSLRDLLGRLANTLSISVGLLGIAMIVLRNPTWGVHADERASIPFPFGVSVPLLPWMLFLIFVCLFAMVTNGWRMIELARGAKLSLGGFVSHFGLAMLLAGLIVSRGFERKEDHLVQEGTPTRMLDYVVELDRHTSELSDRDNKVLFQVSGLDGGKFTARPGLYYYPGADGEAKPMVWPHIQRRLSHDVYFTLHPPAWELWESPATFETGETKTLNGATVTYNELTMDGEPGQAGAGFGAELTIEFESGNRYEVTPIMRIGDGGVEPGLARVGEDLLVSLQGIDAGTQAVVLQMHFAKPIYPVEMFYKPMTLLVWLGTGILTFGVLLSAGARRFRPRPGGAEQSLPSAADVENEDDAALPVA